MDKSRVIRLLRSVAIKYRSMSMLSEIPAVKRSYDEVADALEIACDVINGKTEL